MKPGHLFVLHAIALTHSSNAVLSSRTTNIDSPCGEHEWAAYWKAHGNSTLGPPRTCINVQGYQCCPDANWLVATQITGDKDVNGRGRID